MSRYAHPALTLIHLPNPLAQTMLASQFENFIKNAQGNGMIERLLGSGIFSVDGEFMPHTMHGIRHTACVLLLLSFLLTCGSPFLLGPGDMWKFHRNTARPFFSKDRISDFDNFEKHVQIALDAVQARMKEGYAIDLQVCGLILLLIRPRADFERM